MDKELWDMIAEKGIVFLQESATIDWIEFALKYPGCDSIIRDDEEGDLRYVTIVAYSVSKNNNRALEQVFEERYDDGKHIIMSGISGVQLSGINV